MAYYIRPHMYSKCCMCRFSLRKNGWAKTRSAQPLAMAMCYSNLINFSIYFAYCTEASTESLGTRLLSIIIWCANKLRAKNHGHTLWYRMHGQGRWSRSVASLLTYSVFITCICYTSKESWVSKNLGRRLVVLGSTACKVRGPAYGAQHRQCTAQ